MDIVGEDSNSVKYKPTIKEEKNTGMKELNHQNIILNVTLGFASFLLHFLNKQKGEGPLA